ncbi:hypothetical protein [Nocardiopsis sp. HUAS JQ3]|uniref:hypothetical protein n=1 Tax=Nocardiopsis sp. HUAS JQ3 TaxID=3061629 RepID=UPI0023A968F5|nr:hypothetical protein [Nocardiopsis sp. HUAS JQ3]WDZ90423.1 hypothetical protein PV789_26600 [Nocardiopsis sp. HUAS JQ3]
MATPPVPDYEDLSLRDLDERVRSLPAERVRELIAYEESHSGRMRVLELLKDRLHSAEGGDEAHREPGPEGREDAAADAADARAVPESPERPPGRDPS